MRRPKTVWTAALAAVGLSSLTALAQQPSSRTYPAATVAPASDPSLANDLAADPLMTSRPARYVLRNGLDYLSYREYDRALGFFRVVEKRQGELSEPERQQLRKGIARAQQGKREAINGPHVVAQPKGRPTAAPGSYALAPSKPTPRAANSRGRAAQPAAPEPIQLTSATVVEPLAPVADASAPAPEPTPTPAPLPNPGPVVAASVPSEPPPLDLPAIAPVPKADDLPTIPAAPVQPLPDLTTPPPGAATPAGPPEVAPSLPETAPSVPDFPAIIPAQDLPASPSAPPVAEPSPATTPVAEPSSVVEPTPTPAPTLPSLDAAAQPAEATLPAAPPEVTPEPAPSPTPAPMQDPLPVPGPVAAPAPTSPPIPTSTVEPPPPAEVGAPTGPVGVDFGRAAPGAGTASPGSFSDSLLAPHQRAEVERLAQRSADSPASDRAAAANPTGTGDMGGGNGMGQGSTRLEIQRAPSPTEAREIRKIAVPEEFTNLPPRQWGASRKYFSAAATCHMTLYFQDPVLERYGQSVEQALGPRGRYFSYPLDDPRQSNQRNQILQPFKSIGQFAFQVGTLPYKLIVDPPWESEYDLGYYRPGDRIPKDTIVILPTGVGPPGVGRRY